MRLQRADRAGDIFEPRVEVVDLLPGAVLVEGAGLRALLALLAKLLDGDPVLGGRALVVLEELLFATLTTEHLAHGLTKLVNLVLQSRQARFVPPPLVVLTQGPWTRWGLVHCSASYSSCRVSVPPSPGLSASANDASSPSSAARVATTLAASAGGSYPPSRNATTRPSAWSSAMLDNAAREIAEPPLSQLHAGQRIVRVGVEPS